MTIAPAPRRASMCGVPTDRSSCEACRHSFSSRHIDDGEMPLVEWSRLTGDQTEQLLGVLLLRRYPNAQRVRPAQGDHGIDVYVPGPDGWTVYQIKGFVVPLSASKKRQVRTSWGRFCPFVTSSGQPIAAWHLVRPENATMPERKFLPVPADAPGDGEQAQPQAFRFLAAALVTG